MEKERRKEDVYLTQLLDTIHRENAKEREAFRGDLKDLSLHTDARINTLSKDFRHDIELLGRKIDQVISAKKGDPKLWVSVIGGLAPFLVMAATLVAFAITGSVNPLKEKVHGLEKNVDLHNEMKGHPGALSKHAEHSVNIKDIRDEIEVLRNKHNAESADRWSKRDHERWEEAQLNKRLERIEGVCFGKKMGH